MIESQRGDHVGAKIFFGQEKVPRDNLTVEEPLRKSQSPLGRPYRNFRDIAAPAM